MKCPYCGEWAEKTNGRKVYPHRPDLHHLVFFACMPCDAWVGTHKDSGEPLGRLANAELRKAKQAAHAAFDPHWRSGRMSRRKAYQMLADRLGIDPNDAHIGMFDVEQCRLVVELFAQPQGLVVYS